ncbi:MAG: hypothetical protein IKK22_06035 [Firmicutes bacterium]|nr:hypothetical protein [Bacillota bacterium]MBR2000978.1 hypothetical protein [Bacillota bacterium]MBR4074961.1 hypothetical protein [Bacillota bacterium]MBR7149193.1 hypothetical protein [Bacillota bacterium]
MNPLILLILVFVLKEGRNRPYIWRGPTVPGWSVTNVVKEALEEPFYFDTFRMELILDRLRNLTEMLEKVNRLSQVNQISDALELLGGWEGAASMLQAAEPLLRGIMGENHSEE